ncbi:MAG: hypothetical protein HXY25_08325 [Alphaproteobacteria bacterium]|nr:hypothetical protein [Alphaproteobacteria bacterium]
MADQDDTRREAARRRGPLMAAGAIGATLGGAALGLGLVWVAGGIDTVPALLVLGIGAAAGFGLLRLRDRPGILPPEPSTNGPLDLDGAMRVSLESVLAVVERLPDPFLLIDAEGRVRLSNGPQHPIIAAALPGRHVSAALRNPEVLDAIAQAQRDGRARAVDYVSPVPYEQHILAHVARVRVGLPRRVEGAVRHDLTQAVIVVLHDLTALKRAEQLRADFVANASHELKTPLASLTGFIETLRGHARDDTEARERFLAIMLDQAGRMRRLIDDLLSLSRIELNEHVAPAGRVDMARLAETVVEAVTPLAEEERVDVVTQVSPEARAVIGERDELYQALQNLVDNAIKYGGDGGRVEITVAPAAPDALAAPRPGMMAVSVRDHGSGIPREHVPRLTERFYRVDAKRSRERGGTGLGLAIVKHIATRHRGALEIQSREGEGTVVTLYLPAAPPAPAPGTAA